MTRVTELQGTIPALLTPFDTEGRVDLAAMDAHLAWLRERGVGCVSPLGTTGEGPSLSLAERKAVIEHIARSGFAFVPGTGASALPEAVELSAFALERGAAAVLVAPPWYYDASPVGTQEFFARLLDALPAGAAVLAYHIPAVTGIPIQDDVLDLVAGAKDSSGDLAHTLAWLRDFPSHTILNGSDASAAAFYAAGGRCTLTMLANAFPERLEAIRRGEDPQGNQDFLVRARELVDSFPRHAALKHLLHARCGLPRSRVRPPLDELTPEQVERLEAAHDLL